MDFVLVLFGLGNFSFLELPILVGLFLQSSDRLLGCAGAHRGCADAWKSEELDKELGMFFRPRRFTCKSHRDGDLLGALDAC